MRANILPLLFLLSSGLPGFAQPEKAKVLDFRSTATPQGMQEVGIAVRIVTNLPAPVDAAQNTITLRGAAGDVDLGEWLFRELDQAPAAGPVIREYPVGEAAAVRVFHLANFSNPQQLQELVNLLRTVSDIQRISPCFGPKAVALRGTAAQVALATSLIKALDQPGDTVPPTAAFEYRDPAARTSQIIPESSAVRVFYLKNAGTPQSVQELVNLVRTVSDTQRMYPYQPLKAIVIRATPNQAALVEWLIGELDQPAQAGMAVASFHFQEDRPMGQGDVRVFRLARINTAQELQAATNKLRTETGIQRVFPYMTGTAVAVRGTPSQVTTAEQLVKQWQ